MKQYRQHRQTNEQTRTTEYIAPACYTYLQHRQTDNRTRITDLLATDSQVRNCVFKHNSVGTHLRLFLLLDMGILQC